VLTSRTALEIVLRLGGNNRLCSRFTGYASGIDSDAISNFASWRRSRGRGGECFVLSEKTALDTARAGLLADIQTAGKFYDHQRV